MENSLLTRKEENLKKALFSVDIFHQRMVLIAML